MTASVTRWRPLCAADLAWAEQAAKRAIERWERKWFEHSFLSVTGVFTVDPNSQIAADRSAGLWQVGPHLTMVTDGRAWTGHASKALGLAEPYSAGDVAALITLFSNDLIESLMSYLGSELAPDDQHAPPAHWPSSMESRLPGGGLTVQLGTNGKPRLLEIFCTAERAIEQLHKAPSINSVPTSDAPEAIASAFGDSRAYIAATLGRCRLTAKQLTEISIGDVLPTSQLLSDPVELLLLTGEEAPRRIAHGRPGRTGRHLSIELTSLSSNHAL